MGKKKLMQVEKFQQAARGLGCEETAEAFDAKLRTIAKQKPKNTPDERGGKTAPTAKKR